MPDNNRKVLSERMIIALEQMYSFDYDETTNEIITKLSTCKKQTRHSLDKAFPLNVKSLRKKIVFSAEVLQMWKDFRTDKKLSKFSLFAVNNAIAKLKVMYQKQDKEHVAKLLLTDFNGIRKLY